MSENAGAPASGGRETSARGLLLTLVALLLLAGFSLSMRFAHLGSFSFLVGLGVAAIKAALVGVFFMEIFTEKVTARFAFVTCISLFALLLALVLADILTRSVAPLENPPGTAQRYHG